MLLEALSKSYCTLLHCAAHTHTHSRYTIMPMHAFRWRKDTKKDRYTNKCTHNSPEAPFENLLFFIIYIFILSSAEPYEELEGERGKKKCSSRGAGYLHIYSSGFMSLPADSAA